MATGPGHVAEGGWDGYRVWPHGPRVAGMAIGSGNMAAERLGCQQGLSTWDRRGWDGKKACPHGTREAGMAAESGHMTPGRLRLQHGLAK